MLQNFFLQIVIEFIAQHFFAEVWAADRGLSASRHDPTLQHFLLRRRDRASDDMGTFLRLLGGKEQDFIVPVLS